MATIASQIGDDAVKALKRAVTKNTDEIGEVILKQGEKFEKNDLYARTLKQGKKFEKNKEKYVNDIISNVSEEVDLSLFRNKKSVTESYDDVLKNTKQYRQQERIMKNQRRMASKNKTDDVIILKRRTDTNPVYDEAIRRGFDPADDNFEESVRRIESELATKRVWAEKAKKGSGSQYNNAAATSEPKIPKENSPKTKNRVDNSSPGSAAIDGDNGKLDKFMRQAVPIGIGGGLVFSMFNRNGQMSNSELYGQAKPYGYQ